MTETEWIASTDPAAMLSNLQQWHRDGYSRWSQRVFDRRLRLFACACCRQPEVWSRLVDDSLCPAIAHAFERPHSQECRICSGTGRINRSRRAVEVAERFADDGSECDAEYMRLAYSDPSQRGSFEEELATLTCGSVSAMMANSGLPRWFSVSNKHAARQADLLRHIVGNPFRTWKRLHRLFGEGEPNNSPQVLDTCYLTPLVLDIAQQLYDGKQDAAPILHDALIDAGAEEDSELVRHFAEPPKFKDCPTCDGSGELYGDYWADDGMCQCEDCGGKGEVRNDDDGTHPKGCWALDLILGKE